MTDSTHSASKPAGTASLFDRLRSMFVGPETTVREDIEDALQDAGSDELSAQERRMLRSVLGLHDLRVRDIMVPRADIVSLHTGGSLADVLHVFRSAGHSRIPVFSGGLDAPQGMIHIRDFLELLARLSQPDKNQPKGLAARSDGPPGAARSFGAVDLSQPAPFADIMRPVLFVPTSMPVLDVLVRMQANRTHLAIVIDEYGGSDGLVSIEDVIEVIVGDIEDEHDILDSPLIENAGQGEFLAGGRATFEQLAAFTGIDLRGAAESEDIETIGGLAAMIAGRIPAKGDVLETAGGWELEIVEADHKQVKTIRLRKSRIDPAADNSG